MPKLILFLLLFNGVLYAQETSILAPQAHLYFSLGSATLAPAAKHTIDSLLYADAIPPDRLISIIGYADVLGDDATNKILSKKRSKTVAAYLAYMGVDSSQIEMIEGLGEVKRSDEQNAYPKDRRVTVVFGNTRRKDKLELDKEGALIGTINFKYTVATLQPSSAKLLDSMVIILKKDAKVIVNLNGFVCCYNYDRLSTEKYNDLHAKRFTDTSRLNGAERLSIARAKAIADYFIAKGIGKTRIKTNAFGYTKNEKLPNGNEKHGSDRVEVRALLGRR